MAKTDNDDWDAWHAFFHMRRVLDRALEHELQANSDISAPDYEILVVLLRAPTRQLRARAIAELLGWEKSRLSHQVSRMEKRGLVERRECDDDARGVWVTLTNDGKRAVLGAMRDHSAAIRRYFFDILSDDEQQVLKQVSTRVLAAIDTSLPEQIPLRPGLARVGSE